MPQPVTAQNETSDSCRFELVCAQCSTGCDVPAGISMTSNMIPVCQEVMEGAQAPSRGTTVRSLDIEEGFYRTSARSEDVRECYLEDACVGGSSANSYCAAGYSGPCTFILMTMTFCVRNVKAFVAGIKRRSCRLGHLVRCFVCAVIYATFDAAEKDLFEGHSDLHVSCSRARCFNLSPPLVRPFPHRLSFYRLYSV